MSGDVVIFMLPPNPGKNVLIKVDGVSYARYPIKVRLVTIQDNDIGEVIKPYTISHLEKGDVLFISEKVVAITQGRAYLTEDVKASTVAKILSCFVTRNPAGIGLAMPETMQLAIEECGLWKIFFAAAIAAFTKPFGIKGMFYRLAGKQAAAIDGPVPYAIPPYNKYITKGPQNPDKVAVQVAETLDAPVAIVDANDLGVEILGASRGIDRKLLKMALRDNPLGQSDEQTPIGILRKIISNF